MYSIILLASLSTVPAEPQGILFHRGAGCSGSAQTTAVSAGCSGSQATVVQNVRVKVSNVAAAQPVRTALANINDARPHILRHLFASRAGGCSGGTAFVSTNTVAATGCNGGPAGFARMPRAGGTVVVVPSVQVAPTVKIVPAAPPQVKLTATFSDHRVIKRFLIRHGAPESRLDALEAKVGAASPTWVELLLAFIRGGLQEVLKILTGQGV